MEEGVEGREVIGGIQKEGEKMVSKKRQTIDWFKKKKKIK